MIKHVKIGWKTGMTYQAPRPMDKDYLFRLLDRMAENRMNFLSLVVAAPWNFVPDRRSGFCWPTENPALRLLQDKSSPNCNPDTEFLAGGMEYAKRLGIAVDFMLSWRFALPALLVQAYPAIANHIGTGGDDNHLVNCSRNPARRAYFRELLADLVECYQEHGIHSITVEGPFPERCGICASCKEFFRKMTGTSEPSNQEVRNNALGLSACEVMREWVALVKGLDPGIQFWIHGAPDPIQSADVYRRAGIDCLMNYYGHSFEDPEPLTNIMKLVYPLACCPQTCVRDKPTHNYNGVKTKDPARASWLARNVLERIGAEPNGIGAVFFNEIYLSEANRSAVYEECRQYMENRRR